MNCREMIAYDVATMRTEHVCRKGTIEAFIGSRSRAYQRWLKSYALHRAVSLAVAGGGAVSLPVVLGDLEDLDLIGTSDSEKTWLIVTMKLGPFTLSNEVHDRFELVQGIDVGDYPCPKFPPPSER